MDAKTLYTPILKGKANDLKALGKLPRSLAPHVQQLINDKVELQTKLDAANKELAKFKQQEPVAYRAWFDKDNGARWLFTLWPEEERLDVDWEPLFTAPKATIPGEGFL